MIMLRNLEYVTNLKVDHSVFEQADDFKYLGVNINHGNNMHTEAQQRIYAANRAYFAKNTMLSWKILSWKTKDKLYSCNITNCNLCL